MDPTSVGLNFLVQVQVGKLHTVPYNWDFLPKRYPGNLKIGNLPRIFLKTKL